MAENFKYGRKQTRDSSHRIPYLISSHFESVPLLGFRSRLILDFFKRSAEKGPVIELNQKQRNKNKHPTDHNLT